jgi:putative restriction endonuclease
MAAAETLLKPKPVSRQMLARLTRIRRHPASILIGSHIKPWRECSNEERLQGTNGLLLTPSADPLFDRAFISFDDNGELLVSRVADVRSLKRMGVDPDAPPRPQSFKLKEAWERLFATDRPPPKSSSV